MLDCSNLQIYFFMVINTNKIIFIISHKQICKYRVEHLYQDIYTMTE